MLRGISRGKMIAIFAITCRCFAFLLIVEMMQCFMEGRIPYGSWGPKLLAVASACFWTLANYAEHVEFKKEDASAQSKPGREK